jgi:hypothetical protein
MPVIISFTPTRFDLLRAAYLTVRSRPFLFASLIGVIAIPWMGALIGLIVMARGIFVSPFSIAVLIALPPLVLAASVHAVLQSVRGARQLEGVHTYEFSESEIRLGGPGFDNHLAWTALTRCYGRADGMLCFSGSTPVITIPGRALSPESSLTLRQLMAAKGVHLAGPWNRGAPQRPPA